MYKDYIQGMQFVKEGSFYIFLMMNLSVCFFVWILLVYFKGEP